MLHRNLFINTHEALAEHELSPEERLELNQQHRRATARSAMLELHKIVHRRGHTSSHATIRCMGLELFATTEEDGITVTELNQGVRVTWGDLDGPFTWTAINMPNTPKDQPPWRWAFDTLC